MSVTGLLYEVFTARFFLPRDGEQAACKALVDAGLAVPCAQGKLDGYRVSAAGSREVIQDQVYKQILLEVAGAMA